MNYLIVSSYIIITTASFSELMSYLPNGRVVKRSVLLILYNIYQFIIKYGST